MRCRSWLVVALAVAGCSPSDRAPAAGTGPAFDATVGAVHLAARSGAAVLVGNVFRLYVSDEPNACQGVSLLPVLTRTRLTLVVATSADGSSVARVVPPQLVPGPAQAVGSLVRSTADRPPEASYDAMDGTVTWSANADGSVTVSAMDVGFSGTTDRLQAGGFTLPPCTPP